MSNDLVKQQNLSGEALLKAINSLVQIARMHQDNNDLLVDSARKFVHIVRTAGIADHEVSIQISNGRFYFNKQKLLIRNTNARLFNRMLRFLENRCLYGVHFHPQIENASQKEIVLFARLLDQCVRKSEPSDWLAAELDRRQLNWVYIDQDMPSELTDSVLGPEELSPSQALAAKKSEVRKTYAHVLSTVKEVARKLSANKNVGMRNSIRLVQKMVDLITEDESLFLGVSTIRIYDDYTYVHSLNVAILSMCLGKRIGLTHRVLERLGLCGLFHDLGKASIPKDILNKRGSLSEVEFRELKKHSMHSARLILKLKAERSRKVRLLVPPFEHHMGFDHSGYPKVDTPRRLSLFGRILTITDVYDAITSPRIYRPKPLSPDQALGQMLKQSGTHFDPILLKVFINMMGVYPVGTLLTLDTSEIGVVMPSAVAQAPSRPKVLLLKAGDDGSFSKGRSVDLADQDPLTGKYRRNILASRHPSTLGIQPARFLMA